MAAGRCECVKARARSATTNKTLLTPPFKMEEILRADLLSSGCSGVSSFLIAHSQKSFLSDMKSFIHLVSFVLAEMEMKMQ